MVLLAPANDIDYSGDDPIHSTRHQILKQGYLLRIINQHHHHHHIIIILI
jgi:hypothetical protein